MFVPFAEFAPDQAVLGQTGAPEAQGVVPLTDRSYGPFKSLSDLGSSATGTVIQGAISVRASDGTVHIFAGDVSKLYKYNSGTNVWDDVSRASGYTTPADGRWYFIQMGDRIVATNYTDEIQTYIIGTSAVFANLSAAAPKARYIAVIKGFLVAADTWDATDGYVQNRVWWADHDDPTNWPTPGTAAAAAAQSDYQDIQFGGQIGGLVGGCGGRDGVVFLQSAIVTMDYVGGGVVFAFSDAERGRGTTIPGSIINVGPFAGYIGEEGFFLFDGARSVQIGYGKVDRWFWTNVDQTQLVRICTAIDAKQKLIYWAWQSTSSQGKLDKLLVYNWVSSRWSYIELGTLDFIFTGYTPGYTLEQLDTISADLDALPYSLDSSAWMGGRALPFGFDSGGQIGAFDGDNEGVTLDTGEFPIGERRVFCRGVRPIADLSAGTITCAIGHRDTQGGTVTYTTATSQGSDGVCPQRKSARYMRARIVINDGATFSHIQGVEIYVANEGTR